MPVHDRLTSLDIIEMNNSEEFFGIFNEASKYVPEMRLISASPCTKTEYKTLAKTENSPAVFRESNKGIKQGSPSVEARPVVLKFLDASWSLDQKVALECEWGQKAAIALCAASAMESALQKIAIQTWYGTQADSTGFTGLATLLPHRNSPMVVNAGGSGSGATSVFAIRTELQGVQYAWGQNGRIDTGPIKEAEQWDDDFKKFWAYVQKVHTHVGLQVPSIQVIGRICNITEANPVTESHIAELLNRFPVGKEPNLIFMTRRSLEQIRSQRTATTTTGKEAPYPDGIFGVPIQTTDALSNSEPILTNAPAGGSP